MFSEGLDDFNSELQSMGSVTKIVDDSGRFSHEVAEPWTRHNSSSRHKIRNTIQVMSACQEIDEESQY